MQANLEAFLKTVGLDETVYANPACLPALEEALQLGLERRRGGLEMLPAYLTTTWQRPTTPQRFIVLDAGGTNLRCALVEIGPDSERLLSLHRQPLPGTQGEIEARQFFEILCDLIRPHLAQSRRLAFCFSFSAKILSNRDAQVLHLSKEVYVNGLSGLRLGETLKAVVAEQTGVNDLEVLVLNDTVAALLSALPEVEAAGLMGPIGMIHGTGFNTAYAEPQAPRVEGVGEAQSTDRDCASEGPLSWIYNTESGGFSPPHLAPIDEAVDEASQHPGQMQFEKLVSGVYLGELADQALRAASGLHADLHPEPILSAEFASRLIDQPALSNIEVSTFLAGQETNRLSEALADLPEDRQTVRAILEALYRRTARLLALQVEVLVRRLEHVRPGCPLGLLVEGSTFHQSTGIKAAFLEALKAVETRNHRPIRLLNTREHSNLFGSALAWLTLGDPQATAQADHPIDCEAI